MGHNGLKGLVPVADGFSVLVTHLIEEKTYYGICGKSAVVVIENKPKHRKMSVFKAPQYLGLFWNDF